MIKLSNLVNSKSIIFKLLKNDDFKLFKKFSSGELISFILLYLISFLLNSRFTQQDLGKFSYFYNLLLLIYPFCALNFFEAYLIYFSKADVDQERLVRIIRRTSIIGTILMFIGVFIFTNNIALASLAFIITYNERVYFFRGKLLTKEYKLLKIMSSSLCLIFILLLIFFKNLTFDLAIASYGISYLISAIVGYVVLLSDSDLIKGSTDIKFKEIAYYTIPIMATSIITWVITFSDQYFIQRYYTYGQLAEYSIGNRALNVIRVFTGFFLVYWPMFYFQEFGAKRYSKIKKTRILFISIIALLSIFLIVFGKIIYILLGAGKYIPFLFYFNILIVAEFFRIVAGIFMTFRSFKLQSYYSLIVVAIVGLFNVTINYFFIKTQGIAFAAWSTLFSMVLYFILSLFFGFYPEMKFKKNK